MRIDAISMVSQLYQTNSTKNVQKSGRSYTKDSVEISGFGHELQVAKQAVAETSDIRQDKVDEIKSAMNAGTYNVSMGALADKLLNRESIF